jgi:hypothetical protein
VILPASLSATITIMPGPASAKYKPSHFMNLRYL